MSETITEFNLYKFKQEFLNKLRYGLNSLDTQSRITETTTSFDGDGSTEYFTLSPTNLAYVKSITVGGTMLKFGSEWDIEWRDSNKGKVHIVTAPGIGTDNVVVVWGNTSGNSNFIWGDFPKENLGVHTYPRIGFKLTARAEDGGLGGDQHVLRNDILVQIKIVDVDTFDIDYIAAETADWIKKNAKNFYYFNYIKPSSYNEYDNYDDNTEISHYKMIEFEIPNKLEIVDYDEAVQ